MLADLFHSICFQASPILAHESGLHSFLRQDNIPLCRWNIFFISSSVNGYIYFLAIVSSAVLNMCIYLCVHMCTHVHIICTYNMYKYLFEHLFSILGGLHLGVELLDHVIILCLTFQGTGKVISMAATAFHIPNSSAQRFQFLHTNTCFPVLFCFVLVGEQGAT